MLIVYYRTEEGNVRSHHLRQNPITYQVYHLRRLYPRYWISCVRITKQKALVLTTIINILVPNIQVANNVL